MTCLYELETRKVQTYILFATNLSVQMGGITWCSLQFTHVFGQRGKGQEKGIYANTESANT